MSEFPELSEIADDTRKYLDTPAGLKMIGDVVRANVIAMDELKEVPRIFIVKLCQMARILAFMGAALAKAEADVVLIKMESATPRLH